MTEAEKIKRLLLALKPMADLAKPYQARPGKWKGDRVVAAAEIPEGEDAYGFLYVEGWDNHEITVEDLCFAREVYEEMSK